MQEIDDKENFVANNEGINVPKHNNPSIDQYALDRRPAKYRIQKYPPYLICVDTTKVDPAFFEGWISTPNSDLYLSLVDHVSVYELDENNDGIKKIDPQDLVSIRGALPQWLQIAIDDATFNPDEYADSDIINFVANKLMKTLEDSVSEADKTLVDQMRSIIKRCIAYKGNSVNIASNKPDDQHIKDEINRMCLPFIWDNKFSPIVTDFIHNQLNNDPIKIAKLGFLLGQLAKQGVLGYHHGDVDRQNQANNLLYCLSKTCFDELKIIPNHHRKVTFPDNFFDHLERGICIEGLTDALMFNNPQHQLDGVFKKASR